MARFSSLVAAGVLIGCIGMAFGEGVESQPAQTAPATRRGGAATRARVAPPTPEARVAAGAIVQQYQQMSMSLKLTPDERTKVKAKLDSLIEELEGVHDAAVKKSKEDGEAVEAKTGADRDKLRTQMQEDEDKAQSDYQNLVMTREAEVSALLTPEQRVAWETFKINRALGMMEKNGLRLTDAQWKQIKPLVDGAAKELAESKDGASGPATVGKLMKRLVSEVLTESQAGQVLMAGSPTLAGLTPIPGAKVVVDRDLP